MKEIMKDTENVLNSYIGGFHQYILEPSARLGFVSENFCAMVGYTKEELLRGDADAYAALVHPADSRSYADFINGFKGKERTATAQYRLVGKDGRVLYVSDSFTSKRSEDGRLVGYSVLTDITTLKTENENLKFLNETIPCGFLKYTCEKHPRITYINEQMLKILRFTDIKDGESDYLELYKENIYLMLPMEERRRFARFLERVYSQESPVAGEITILRCDGTKACLFGWVTKCTNEKGESEFQSVCMDITERRQNKKAKEIGRYLKALTEVYDKIFEYDLSNRTVKCIHEQKAGSFKGILNIPMQLEEATEQWIQKVVFKADREEFRELFYKFYKGKLSELNRPAQIKFRAVSSVGMIKTYSGIFLKIDSSVSLLCCRNVSKEQEQEDLRDENISLRNRTENMQELMMHFTDGIAAFEVKGDSVTPLFANENVCEFFGFSKEEFLPMMKKSNSIKEFVSRSGVDYEDFIGLLENGEAEFTYFDLNTKTLRRIKAICSQKTSDDISPRYVMLYKVNGNASRETDDQSGERSIYIRTFGYFDVFVDEKPIAFRNKKSKELFALLVDRRGGYVTSEEAIGYLWEDEPTDSVTLARYRKVALRLKNILEEYGIADIVEAVDGKRRIVADKVRCDLYDYLSGREEYASLFKGNYLTNYSWSELTLGELLNKIVY